MLAGCSSTYRSLQSMSTQRLDLPCNFPRKDVSRPQLVRPGGLSVEKPIETITLKQCIKVPPSLEGRREIKAEGLIWGGEKGKKGLKRRLSEQACFDEEEDEGESCFGRAKRKKSGGFGFGEEDEGFWVQPGFVGVNFQQMPFSISCAGEDEEEEAEEEEQRVCYVSTDVVSPNPWVESEVTEYGGEEDPETRHGSVREMALTSGSSSSSSESHTIGLRLSEPISDHGYGNGSTLPRLAHNNNDGQNEQHGFELISYLVGCIEAIVSRNVAGINHFIAKLGEESSPRSRATISRLVAYFTEGLALRVTRSWPHVFHLSVPREFDRFDDDSGAAALRLLNQISPIPKFIHFAGNEMLLKAFEGKDKVHIIDFDIKQGLQWPGFFQSLAFRRNPPSHVRITGIGESKQDLIETGERLAGFAEAFNLPFEFHPVVDRLEDVRLWMLHVKDGESVAINCVFQLHKTLYDTNGGAFRDFMGLIQSTNPIALFMAEQEADHNEPNLEIRVCNSLRYYSAIFDSMDSTLPYDSTARVKIEEIFGHEIRNMIACEGTDRVERHERFRNWKSRMEEQGFRAMKTEDRELFQSRMLLKMYPTQNYGVEQQGEEAITLSWLDQPLYTVSLWVPIDAAGSSSGFSQPS